MRFGQLCVGGLGGTGGNARTGGEGGDGEGPKLDINPDERWKVGNISGKLKSASLSSHCLHLVGGTGGTGGIGIEVGGKGGTGKAPVITILRRSRVLVANHRP